MLILLCFWLQPIIGIMIALYKNEKANDKMEELIMKKKNVR